MKKWLLVFLFPTLGYAADPCPSCNTEMIIDDVSGGWATVVPRHKLDKSFSPNLRNVFIDEDKIKQINGFIQVGSTSTLLKGEGIFPFYKETGETSFLVTDSSVILETSDFNTYVFVSSAHNTGVVMRCKQINNEMWCSNGVDAPVTWNGSVKKVLDGTKGFPNVPKGKYIGFFGERVWMYGLPTDASGVAFSDIRSTNGAIISPDNFLAWPGGNLLHVGQGDGQIGTAIWVENGRLKFGKERSIHTLFGTNSSNFEPVPSNPTVGVASHDSVVMMDNESNFLGNDGIYRGEKRKSDLIDDQVNLIDRSAVRTISDLWESQTDFTLKGSFFTGTTATIAGLLTLDTLNPNSNNNPLAESFITPTGVLNASDDPPSINPGTTFYGFVNLNVNLVNPYSKLMVNKLAWAYSPVGGCDLNFASVTIRNLRQGLEEKAIGGLDADSRLRVRFGTTGAVSPLFEGFDILNSSIAIKFEGCGFDLADISDNGLIHLINSTTGQYVSQVTTIPMVTTWGTFDSLRSLNSGTVGYFLRASTSVVNISTQVWQGIVPGVTINVPITNTYVQWATTITSVSTFTSIPTIDNVQITHIEGVGASNRAFGINWRNRFWLSVSTSASSISSLIIARSKITNKNPDAYMPISGINIRSLAKDREDILYAGSSSTGAFYRLDYGENFNGKEIQSFYETPDFIGDSIFREKEIFEYYIVADKSPGSSFNVGLSKDGQGYTSTAYSLNGSSGTLNRIIQNVRGKSKTFSWKISHSLLNDPFTFHNFAVLYQPTEVRKGINE